MGGNTCTSTPKEGDPDAGLIVTAISRHSERSSAGARAEQLFPGRFAQPSPSRTERVGEFSDDDTGGHGRPEPG